MVGSGLASVLPARAVEQAITLDVGDTDGGAGGIGGGGGAAGGGNPANGNTGGGSSSSGAIRIACIGEDGQIKNASETETCKAVLPKCSALKKSLEDKVRDLMTQKIWGYYNGKDVDLARSSPNNLVGTDLPYPICSVVGHKLTGSESELKNQLIGKKQSCGLRPRVDANREDQTFALKYEGQNGALWISYMLGAYPWLIRKHASDVLKKLEPDLSNVDALLATSKAMSADIAKINQQMRDYSQKLSAEAKTACLAPNSNLLQACIAGKLGINDPAQRVCTIVKAQLASNEGALPNMLAFEIMQRVQKEYDATFSKIISFQEPTMKKLKERCEDTGEFGATRKGKLSETASCFFGGKFCTTDDGTIREDGPGVPGKCKRWEHKIGLVSGRPITVGGFMQAPEPSTRSLGFAAVIERLIRVQVCGQKKPSDANVCDDINLPSKPANAP